MLRSRAKNPEPGKAGRRAGPHLPSVLTPKAIAGIRSGNATVGSDEKRDGERLRAPGQRVSDREADRKHAGSQAGGSCRGSHSPSPLSQELCHHGIRSSYRPARPPLTPAHSTRLLPARSGFIAPRTTTRRVAAAICATLANVLAARSLRLGRARRQPRGGSSTSRRPGARGGSGVIVGSPPGWDAALRHPIRPAHSPKKPEPTTCTRKGLRLDSLRKTHSSCLTVQTPRDLQRCGR